VIRLDPELSDYADAVGGTPELVELIDNPQQVVTVFVPTNEAIALVPNWDQIAADPVALEEFVRSHLVDGPRTIEDLFVGTAPYELPTLSGDPVTVDPQARTINGARIVTPDVRGTNGIVHTIDRLFVVPTVTPTTTTQASTTVATAPPG
jgi:uncharacterized surface protein with fasciclin (FAS1) repeats